MIRTKKRRAFGLSLVLLMGFGLTSGTEGKSEAAGSKATPFGSPPEDSLFIPEGLEVTLWAESPMIFNPTSIDVDEKGRLWAVEAVDYRNFRNPPEDHLSHPQGERVVILEDTDGDGRADSSKVFVQDEDLVAPLGIAVLGNKVYVSASPTVYVYTDTDGDDRADEREVFLTGFGGLDHDHGLHALVAGPDGRLYFNAGNAGPHIVTDKADWTLRAGSIYSGGSPYMEGNQPGLVSDDGRVWTGGVQLRIDPDGTGLEVLADNFRNAYELAVDSYGNLWNNDNDDDGNAGTRVLWTMEGSNTGYFSADGSRRWQADRRPGQDTFTAHWHQEDPGVIPAGDPTGPGAPTGIVFYEGDALGEEHRGTLLSADAGRNVIHAYQPEPEGAGYDLERFSFFSTLPESVIREDSTYKVKDVEDRRYWFRPSDVAAGTDGAIYVSDWYDPRVGGHQMRENEGYGRIYRITPEGEELPAPELDLSTTEGQIQALLNPAPSVRYLGFQRLKAQGDTVAQNVKELLDADNPYHRARAVWLLAQLGPEGLREVEALLGASEPEMRTVAFRALRQVKEPEEVLVYARQLARDASPAVRREVAILLRDVPLEESRDLMLELARQYEGGDRWELEAYGLAAEGEEEAVYELLKDELGSADPSTWSEPWADLVWRLHPVAAVDDLKARALSPELSGEEKERAMVALGFIDDPEALRAMEELAQSDQPEVAERARWWLDYRRTNEWHDLKDWAAEEKTADEEREAQRLQTLREEVLQEDVPTQERIAAAEEMAESASGGRQLLSLIADGALPAGVQEAVREGLLKNPDRTVRVLARYYLERPEAEAFEAEAVVALESDPQRGQMVFYAKCAVCHRVGVTGGDVGPELTGVKNVFGREGLADAIIHPSSGIAHGYSPWVVKTDDGEVIYGFLLAENEATLIVRDADGRDRVIDRGRVVSRESLEVSLMPGPAELELSEQDVADLVEFLMNVEAE